MTAEEVMLTAGSSPSCAQRFRGTTTADRGRPAASAGDARADGGGAEDADQSDGRTAHADGDRGGGGGARQGPGLHGEPRYNQESPIHPAEDF